MSAYSTECSGSLASASGAYKGVSAAVGCFILWGLFPLYIHSLIEIPAFQIIAHRIFWSLPVAIIILLATRSDLRSFKLCLNRATFAGYLFTSVVIAINWGIYVWAINNGYTMDAALAYYIAPLLNVVFGFILYKERLSYLQWTGVGFAILAVLILAINGSSSIWIIVLLPLCISVYGAAHRRLPLPAAHSFSLEVLILFIPTCLYLIYSNPVGGGYFLSGTWDTRFLLFGSALLTAVPLILYALSVKYVSLSTVGILQYIAPTCVFLTSYLIFKEQVTPITWLAYILLWVGVVFYIFSSLQQLRSKPN